MPQTAKGRSASPDPSSFYMDNSLEKTGSFESFIGAVFVDGLDSVGRKCNRYLFVEFRNEESLLLQINLAALLASRVELRRTRTVTVASADLRFFSCYYTFFCHSVRHVSTIQSKYNSERAALAIGDRRHNGYRIPSPQLIIVQAIKLYDISYNF